MKGLEKALIAASIGFAMIDKVRQDMQTLRDGGTLDDAPVPDRTPDAEKETPATVYVNLVGGPCCGKSTVASGLFNKLKLDQKLSTELVTEVVKDYVYDENKQALEDQLLITAVQNHNLRRLNGKVEVVITDASLLNGIVYNRFYGVVDKVMEDLALHLFKKYSNVVYLLPRKPKYDQYGRSQSEEEAKEIDRLFIEVLDELGVQFYDMRTFKHEQLPEKIAQMLQ